jgi:peptidoglycan/LPS O-acetylase OafA/YrhL
MNVTNNNRIAVLDSFRAIAILAVVFYHYFYRWNDPITPYAGADYFHYGFKGVPFFFMISGFVICYTLESTSGFKLFWKKRFIRLFPSMLVASVFTFVFLLLFDNNRIFDDSNHFRNLITSLTFLPPNLFDWILGTKNQFSYLNFSYWSLWPEIQFYFLSSVIYFWDKFNFRRNFVICCFVLVILYFSVSYFNLTEIKIVEKLINLFNLLKFLPFFLSGSLFYILYRKRELYFPVFLLLILLMIINFSLAIPELIATVIMFGLFFCFIYYPKLLFFLENGMLMNIGVSSYFLYLIHEYVGVVWIRNFVSVFYPYSFIAPILMIVVMVFISIFYTLKIEPKITLRLKNYLLKK